MSPVERAMLFGVIVGGLFGLATGLFIGALTDAPMKERAQ